MTEWFQDESFWIETYPFIFSDEKFERADQQIEQILSLIEFDGDSVLDLCCGPGRHAVALAKRGFTVTGVDATPFLLDKARETAQAQNVDIEWVLEDMRDFVRPAAYDLVLNMFTSFGYFDNKDDDLKVLHNILENLKPDGICIVDVIGKESLAKKYQPTISHNTPDGTILVQRHEIFDDWTRIRNEWIIIRNGKTKTFKFHHTIYSGQELKDLLGRAGFKKVQLFGGLDGGEYGPDATRLIAVARKK